MRDPIQRRGPGGFGQPDLFSRPGRGAPAGRVLSVSELTRELKGTIETRFPLVSVRGELSNFKPAPSGHLYFTLKDEGACLSAVMFRSDAARVRFALRDGLSVIARGRLSVYEARGQYQIICDNLDPEGAGALALAFEQLKTRLAREGLFDPARKRQVPFLPRRIGLVTSPTGAAIRDFLRVLHDRFPIPVLLAPVRVQGDGAAEEIARAVRRLADSGLVDVIVVTRGGGSIEDLWAFNEEVLARQIADCAVPVVSAVGHEVDFTIADFVADKRCATPTDAAKTLAPPREELARALDKHRRHLSQILLRQLGLRRERLQHRAGRLVDPRWWMAQERLALDHRVDLLRQSMARQVSQQRAALTRLAERLERAHPRSRLLRLSRILTQLEQAMSAAMRQRLGLEDQRLDDLGRRLGACSPGPSIAWQHRQLAGLRERAEASMRQQLGLTRLRLSRASAGLESLSPLGVLARGYSIAFLEQQRVLVRAADAPPGTRIRLLLPDRSELTARVEPDED